MTIDIKSVQLKMDTSIEAFKKELTGVRTGRAHPSMLDMVEVDVYGSYTPLKQCANITVLDNRTLVIAVWDRSLISAVEKAIREKDFNPQSDGGGIRVFVPELTEERRKDLKKVASAIAEKAKVAVRNIRRDGLDFLKKEEKNGLSEDESKRLSTEIQKITDASIKTIDDVLGKKETEIMQI